jgi:hypothetical protein
MAGLATRDETGMGRHGNFIMGYPNNELTCGKRHRSSQGRECKTGMGWQEIKI